MDVHPAADLFPMMTEEELQELAEDIKAHGLRHPIVKDKSGLLIDGRNRRAACQLAGVEPEYETYEGDDIDDYVYGVNIARRNLDKSQKAMITARHFLLNRKSEHAAMVEVAGLSMQYVSRATVVLKFMPELERAVVCGDLKLNDAYEKARAVKDGRDLAAEAAVKEQQDRERRLLELRQAFPELAEMVDDERLTLEGAEADAKQRKENERVLRYSATRTVVEGISMFRQSADPDSIARVVSRLDYDIAKELKVTISEDALREAAAFAVALADALERQRLAQPEEREGASTNGNETVRA